MTQREKALETIRIEVAKEGKIGQSAMRAYIENRVSYKAFKEAAAIGMRQYLAALPA